MLPLIAGLLLCLCSCSKHIYTHSQVMQSFHTKNDVIKRFGTPSATEKNEISEIWTYNIATAATNTAKTTDTLANRPYIQPGKYIKFMFDTTGHVMGYKSNDVNLGYTKRDSFGKGTLNVLTVLGAIALVLLFVILDIAANGSVTY